jgi:hypothetical protein
MRCNNALLQGTLYFFFWLLQGTCIFFFVKFYLFFYRFSIDCNSVSTTWKHSVAWFEGHEGVWQQTRHVRWLLWISTRPQHQTPKPYSCARLAASWWPCAQWQMLADQAALPIQIATTAQYISAVNRRIDGNTSSLSSWKTLPLWTKSPWASTTARNACKARASCSWCVCVLVWAYPHMRIIKDKCNQVPAEGQGQSSQVLFVAVSEVFLEFSGD